MKGILFPGIVLGFMVIGGCGSHSRYNPDSRFGDMARVDSEQMKANLSARGKGNNAQEQKQSLVWGKSLFSDTSLGTNGQSCNSCHPGGGTTGGEARIEKKMGHGPYILPIPSLVGAASRFPKYKVPNAKVITLQQMNNNCIRMFLAGKRLPFDSPESIALASHVTSLAEGEVIEVAESKH